MSAISRSEFDQNISCIQLLNHNRHETLTSYKWKITFKFRSILGVSLLILQK
ncbi:hypothetical protein SAMN02745132_04811 [Enterovibrio nigricans DSM 22720]|uniref:Uncharacterized protein n=1 Tax=Enterovibrio nigricans DSM 22720 TaxID=1121868 RepID=A0A1T4W7M4_9GAMM|nr:hypothetical protein SAMN02745132_04811 [Enterovibrio nigricans DSM 22720]